MNKFKDLLKKEIVISELLTQFRIKISRNKIILFIILLYFLTRFINLTLLPIFNDESIYLNWGWGEVSGFFYQLSLADGKQPFLIWIFGFSQHVIKDPLVAGRFVSIITGFISLLTIYLISETFINRKTAVIASLIYVCLPIFVLYDRLALMESAMTMVGLCSLYFFLMTVNKFKYSYALICALTLGLGMYIKSTGYIFLIISLFLGFVVIITSKKHKEKIFLIKAFLILLFISQIILLELYVQPQFINIIKMNSRYSLTFSQIITFPYLTWLRNLKAFLLLNILFITPFISVITIGGIYQALKSKDKNLLIIASWLILGILFFVIFTTNPISRYLVIFIPTSCILGAYFISSLKSKKLFSALIIILILPMFLSISLIKNPTNFYDNYKRVFNFSDEGYTSIPSGYGIPETIKYVRNHKGSGANEILIRSASGNPEDAVAIYFRNEKRTSLNIMNSCEDAKYILMRKNKTFFIIGDVNKNQFKDCLKESTRFYKLDGKHYVGIYKVISPSKNSLKKP